MIHNENVNINQEIMKEITGRTLEAIKGKRRGKAYKKMVEDLIQTLLLNPENREVVTTTEGSLTEDEVMTAPSIPNLKYLEKSITMKAWMYSAMWNPTFI